MRDTARHIGPGGLALRRLQLSDVVESNDESTAPRAAALGGDANKQRAPTIVMNQRNLRLNESFGLALRRFE